MNPPAEAGEQTARFDLWGLDLAATEAGERRQRATPAHTRASWRALTCLGIAVAATSALIVHLAAGGEPATATRLSSSERTIAAAINLRSADVPGFAVDRRNSDITVGGDPSGAFRACYGASAASLAGNAPQADSATFVEHGGISTVSLGSGVSFSSPAQIDRDARLAGDSRVPQCFAQAMAALTFTVGGTQITGGDASAAVVPMPVVGGQAILAMRARMSWTANAFTVPSYLDLYLVGVGREEISLYTFATEQPYSSAAERLLLSELVTRAFAEPH